MIELDPQARVTVSSGYAVDPVLAKPDAYGFSGVITKPYAIQDLIDEVARLCDRKK